MAGIIINWIDTIASIPSDWLLCDGNNSTPNLLGKYLLSVGASENPGTTGGSATHTHDSPAHGHTQDTHSHTGTTSASSGSAVSSYAGSPAATPHTHSSDTTATTATNQTTIVTVNTSSNDPTYYKIAPIIDNTTAGTKYPNSSCIYWGQTSLPVGWFFCDGTGGTPDLRNKFLKCVDAAENPGTTGGSATHTHTTTAHTHTQDGHTHSGTTGNPSAYDNLSNGTGVTASLENHTHTISTDSIAAVNQNAIPDMDTINGEPTFKKLGIIQNISVANRPKYAIVMWSGTIANIPLGYVLCDGTNETPNLLDYFVKGALDYTEIEDTGGNSVHTHTANSHNHTQNSHTHTISIAASSTERIGRVGADVTYALTTHTHAAFTSGTTTATNQSTTITISNCSSQANYPEYYKVAYIMQDRELDVGAYAFIS